MRRSGWFEDYSGLRLTFSLKRATNFEMEFEGKLDKRADVERNKRTVDTQETFQNKRKMEGRRDVKERKVWQEGH